MPHLLDIDISAEAVRRPPVRRKRRSVLPFAVDALVISAVFAAFAAAALWFEPYPFDAMRDQWRIFCALLAVIGVAYSWVAALLGTSVRTLAGTPPSPLRAFVRALLAVVSVGLAGFGVLLALFDPRGQTLHDKLCGCVVDPR